MLIMKNILVVLFLLLAGSISSGYISSASSRYVARRAGATANPAPGMVFPVAGKRSIIGSFWGATREGGKRKHEGIDIFAAKRTPVVAVNDGIVVDVGNTAKGGKTIWLRSFYDDFYYYYAHLDRQLVRIGESVKKGQYIGTVGNTGNAKLTPPHLHFGIYSFTGAIDPLPHIKDLPKIPLLPKSKKAAQQIASNR
jgi:murein DD-endopeptidase MepM/ murein hydrolase activator NlpD